MCGRYKLSVPFREIVRLYNLMRTAPGQFDNMPARYNIAPTQDVLAINTDPELHGRVPRMLRWGLVPFSAKNLKIGYSTINAMCETVATKSTFREAFKYRRCIIPADGFYEWAPTGGKQKQPYLIRMKGESVFGIAGLWETWKDKASDEILYSCTIITCPTNELCAPIHNRMPAILDPTDYARWLGEEPATPQELRVMLRPYPAKRMEAVKIGQAIGNVKNEGPELIEPVAV